MGHWTISSALEPIYVDDKLDNPNYDSRLDPENIDCMMCPCSLDECDKRDVCYWDEVWRKEDEEAEKRTRYEVSEDELILELESMINALSKEA